MEHIKLRQLNCKIKIFVKSCQIKTVNTFKNNKNNNQICYKSLIELLYSYESYLNKIHFYFTESSDTATTVGATTLGTTTNNNNTSLTNMCLIIVGQKLVQKDKFSEMKLDEFDHEIPAHLINLVSFYHSTLNLFNAIHFQFYPKFIQILINMNKYSIIYHVLTDVNISNLANFKYVYKTICSIGYVDQYINHLAILWDSNDHRHSRYCETYIFLNYKNILYL